MNRPKINTSSGEANTNIHSPESANRENYPGIFTTDSVKISNSLANIYNEEGFKKNDTQCTFRVKSRKNLRPKKFSKNIERLSSPKEEFIPNDPFLFSDFRGLLNRDYQKALSICFSQEQLNQINQLESNPYVNF